MNQKFLGVVLVVLTWVAVVYLVVAAMVFWTATQRDLRILSVQVVARNVVRSLFWIKELF